MESYFFVPGTRLHKINDIQKLNVSHIIIDLEDAIKLSERDGILNDLILDSSFKNHYIRIPLYDANENLDLSVFSFLVQHGFRKFVFPKIQKSSDFELIFPDTNSLNSDLKIILLLETCRFLFEAKDVLLKYERLFDGIGLGSHDFMSEVGGEHDLKNLEFVRSYILYLARMIKIKAIDIVSMELSDSETYSQEILDGLYRGFDAKFFIHPWQINLFNSLSLYSPEEIEWAQKIKKEFIKKGGLNEFSPTVIDGKVIERPHLNKVEKILKYYETKQFR